MQPPPPRTAAGSDDELERPTRAKGSGESSSPTTFLDPGSSSSSSSSSSISSSDGEGGGGSPSPSADPTSPRVKRMVGKAKDAAAQIWVLLHSRASIRQSSSWQKSLWASG